jgi:DNA-binding transcriptional regulator YiaG
MTASEASEKLKKWRKQTNLSQAKFGNLLGIPTANISKWEQGTSTPPEYVISLIEQVLVCKNLI